MKERYRAETRKDGKPKGKTEESQGERARDSWNIAKKRMLEHRGAIPREEGDSVRGCKAMQEDNFFKKAGDETIKSGREDFEGGKERVAVVSRYLLRSSF